MRATSLSVQGLWTLCLSLFSNRSPNQQMYNKLHKAHPLSWIIYTILSEAYNYNQYDSSISSFITMTSSVQVYHRRMILHQITSSVSSPLSPHVPPPVHGLSSESRLGKLLQDWCLTITVGGRGGSSSLLQMKGAHSGLALQVAQLLHQTEAAHVISLGLMSNPNIK